MGLFTTSTSTTSEPQVASDGGYIAPDRVARGQCWNGRDQFFACLDRNGIIDSVKDDAKARQACAKELADFEKVCKDSWVTYFKKRRVMEHQRDATLKKLSAEGATGMDVATAAGSGTTALKGQ